MYEFFVPLIVKSMEKYPNKMKLCYSEQLYMYFARPLTLEVYTMFNFLHLPYFYIVCIALEKGKYFKSCVSTREQGCGLQNIMRSPKIPDHEILGAQHLSLYEKTFPVTQRQKLVACGTQALLEHSSEE